MLWGQRGRRVGPSYPGSRPHALHGARCSGRQGPVGALAHVHVCSLHVAPAQWEPGQMVSLQDFLPPGNLSWELTPVLAAVLP